MLTVAQMASLWLEHSHRSGDEGSSHLWFVNHGRLIFGWQQLQKSPRTPSDTNSHVNMSKVPNGGPRI